MSPLRLRPVPCGRTSKLLHYPRDAPANFLQLADGREWLFDTELPSLADISVHFVYAWIKPFRGVESLFDPKTFPKSLEVRRTELNWTPVLTDM